MYATQQLRDDHEGIKVVLSVLEHLAGELDAGRPVETADLAAILDFLKVFADKCHHGKEEDLLFPALAAAGVPTEGGPIGVMLHDHAQGRALIAGMAQALERMPDGPGAGRDFAVNALGYASLLRAHITKENMILFVMAEQALPAGEHERLAAEFERVEQERIGAGTHERYQALIHELAKRYL